MRVSAEKMVVRMNALKGLALWAYKKRGACPLPSGNAKSERTYATLRDASNVVPPTFGS
jgi:hypothetical protein